MRDLPETLLTTLQDTGVTQAQLDRLVLREARKPTELLRDILEEAGALQSEINTAMNFAEKFANTRLADQAAQLAALGFQLEIEEAEFKAISAERKELIRFALEERKTILEIALDNPTAGITLEDDIDTALSKVAVLPVKSEVLSVSEAKTLGVPFGTTKEQALGITPGDEGVVETKREKDFWSSIDRGVNELQQGEVWGNVWNRIKARFPEMANETIDNALGTAWREPGAFQQFRQQKGSTSSLYDTL